MSGTALMGTRLIVVHVCMQRRHAPATIRAALMKTIGKAMRRLLRECAAGAAVGVTSRPDGAFYRHICLLPPSLTWYLHGLADLRPISPPKYPPSSGLLWIPKTRL
jgi:hypothetical protein